MKHLFKLIVIAVPLIVAAVLWIVGRSEFNDSVLQLRIGVGQVIWGVGVLLSLLLALGFYLVYRRTSQIEAVVHGMQVQNEQEQQQFRQRLDHELKNPLTALLLSAENLHHQSTNEILTSDINNISVQAQRLSQLTGDLRKLNLFDKQDLDFEQVDVSELLDDLVEMAKETNLVGADEQHRELKLIVPVAPWPVPHVIADRDLLQLALYNLLENAVKYSNSGDTVELQVTEDNQKVKIVIADTGSGIAASDRSLVFDELFRGSNARHQTGSGIGLSLVKRIVDRHSGTIAVDSKEHQGTRVTLHLPVARQNTGGRSNAV